MSQMSTRDTTAQSGALLSLQMESFTRLAARMEPSKCGRTVMDRSDCGWLSPRREDLA